MKILSVIVPVLALAALLVLGVIGVLAVIGPTEGPKPLSSEREAPSGPPPSVKNPLELAKVEAQTKADFERALAERPEASATWDLYQQYCEALAKQEKPDAKACYDRYLAESRKLNFDPLRLSHAYRWRTILAIREGNRAEAEKFYPWIEAYEKEAGKFARLPKELAAYTRFIHAGVLELQGQRALGAAELRTAIALHKESGSKETGALYDYYEKLAEFLKKDDQWFEAIAVYEQLEEEMKAEYGEVHPVIAVIRMKRINAMVYKGDRAAARSLWDYVERTIGRIRPDRLPKDVDDLYVQTMVLLDSHDLLSPQGSR